MALKRILIVDDARDIGRVYQQALQDAYPRATITYVPSGEEAIVETLSYEVDLLVADIRLPGMSGFDLVRRVQQRQRDVKVVMITGIKVDDDLIAQCRDVGAATLLKKPIAVPDFLEAIRKTIIGELAPQATAAASTARKTKRGSGSLSSSKTGPKTDATLGETELSRKLEEMRSSLGGLAAWLVDETSRMTAKAGDWPGSEMARLIIPDVLDGVNSAAKVSRMMGVPIPESVTALRGPEYDLLAAPAGRFVLLIFLKKDTSALRLALGFEAALQAQKTISQILFSMGLNIHPVIAPPTGGQPDQGENAAAGQARSSTGSIKRGTGSVRSSAAARSAPEPAAPVRTPIPPPPPTRSRPPTGSIRRSQSQPPPVVDDSSEAEEAPPEDLRALELLLNNAKKGKQDADAFWDNLSNGEPAAPSDNDVLTYEQALKLGLLNRNE